MTQNVSALGALNPTLVVRPAPIFSLDWGNCTRGGPSSAGHALEGPPQ